MNRLNRIIYMHKRKLGDLYHMYCLDRDIEDIRKRRKEIVMLAEEKEVWEGIRDSIRGRVKGE